MHSAEHPVVVLAAGTKADVACAVTLPVDA